MRVPADQRVDRSFWLIGHDDERYFPIRIPRKGEGGIGTFVVSNAGNRRADALEIEKIEDVEALVIGQGYSVRAVPESDITAPPNLLKLNKQKIATFGSDRMQPPPSVSYWSAFANACDREEAGWAQSDRSWVRTKHKRDAQVVVATNAREQWVRIGVELIGDSAERAYETLLALRATVERDFGEPLIWDTKEGRTNRQIFTKLVCDSTDRTDWSRQHEWLTARLPRFERLLETIA